MDFSATEVNFAQKLAANEKGIRLKALKQLKKWLKAKSSSKKTTFSEQDYLAIWKGLHYCLWMQDKMLIQEELSSSLSRLVHEISGEDSKMLFLHVFFETEAREWNNIDQWRIDKFMMLVRNVLHEAVCVVKEQNYRTSTVSKFSWVLSDTVMQPRLGVSPDGLKLHLVDIYLDEVQAVVGNKDLGQHLNNLLQPFMNYLHRGENFDVVKRIVSYIFTPIIKGRMTMDSRTDNSDDESSDSGADNSEYIPPTYTLKFDLKKLEDELFSISKNKTCINRNRSVICNLIQRLKDTQAGIRHEETETDIKPALSKTEIDHAFGRLVRLIKPQNKNKKEKQKAMKRLKKERKAMNSSREEKENLEAVNDSQEQMTPSNEEETSPSKKRKRKRKLSQDGVAEEQATDMDTPNKKKKLLDGNATSEGVIAKTKKGKMKKKKQKDASKQTVKNKNHDLAKMNTTEEQTDSPSTASSREGKDDSFTSLKSQQTADSSSKKKKKELKKEKKMPKSSVKQKPGDEKQSAASTASLAAEPLTKGEATPVVSVLTGEATVASIQEKNGKRGTSHDGSFIKGEEASCPKVELTLKGANVKGQKIPSDSDLQDGEIEIWIPNKKYKGNQISVGGGNSEKFASFEKSTIPSAFVKRAAAKLAPKTTQTSLKPLKEPQADTPSEQKRKRVSFDMNQNMAVEKDRLQLDTKFNPAKKPEQGILKTPSPMVTQNIKPTPTRRAQALSTPVTLRSAKKLKATKAKHATKKLSAKCDFYL